VSDRVRVIGSPIPFEAERETMTEADRIEFLIAGRPDLTSSQRTYLRGVGDANRVAELLSEHPKTTAAGAATTRAARLPAQQHRELTSRFGRSDRTTPHWEGNEFVLPQITREQARAILQRHARDYGSDPNVPMRKGAGEVTAEMAAVSEIAASVARRVKVRGE
jgi:hypothetical protein